MKKLPKLMVFDIDGTLVGGFNTEIGDLTREVLTELHEAGVILGIASGRPLWQQVERHASEWGLDFQFDFLIGLNGGELKDAHTGKVDHFHYLSPDLIREVVEKMRPLNDNPLIYKEGYELTREIDEMMGEGAKRRGTKIYEYGSEEELYDEPTAKILYRFESVQKRMEIEKTAKTFETEDYSCFSTGPKILEFQSPLVNKGEALKVYCLERGIDLKDTAAFGDAENDLAMLETAGTAVALKNSHDCILAAADYVTEYDSGEDGAARFIRDFWL